MEIEWKFSIILLPFSTRESVGSETKIMKYKKHTTRMKTSSRLRVAAGGLPSIGKINILLRIFFFLLPTLLSDGFLWCRVPFLLPFSFCGVEKSGDYENIFGVALGGVIVHKLACYISLFLATVSFHKYSLSCRAESSKRKHIERGME